MFCCIYKNCHVLDSHYTRYRLLDFSVLEKVIKTGYKALQLEYFFTAGKDEVRAWTIQVKTEIIVYNFMIIYLVSLKIRGAVVAQWIRPWTLNGEVPLNLLATAVVPLGKVRCPHCLVPRKGLKAVGPLVACL